MNLHGINFDPQRAVTTLPLPDAAALAHSTRLVDRIRAEIENQGGHIGFDRYMEMTLYEAGLGYYSAGARKFGQEGDFVTAPEISSLFSICLAHQCRQILADLPDGSILELGAGTGRMACDILLELQRCGDLPLKYFILETSADLKQRQRQLLQAEVPDYFSSIIWLERLPAQPFTGVVLANEVMDALPVHRIVDRQGVLNELRVQWHTGGFTWLEVPAGPALNRQTQDIKLQLRYPWPAVYTTEISMTLAPWLAALSDSLRQGVMLLIDYGYPRSEYYHPDRVDGTLLCHYRHRVHADPFLYPGLQDITASVDFTAVATAAVAVDLEVTGYTDQTYFLLGCGLDEILARHSGSDQRQYLERVNQAKLLTLSGGMGERFKAIALSRGMKGGLTGFAVADQRRHL